MSKPTTAHVVPEAPSAPRSGNDRPAASAGQFPVGGGKVEEPVDTTASNTAASASPTSLNDHMTLSELDQTMAADLDQMLQGNFESIDAVLDGVFEEQAVLVQSPDGVASTPNARRTEQREVISDEPAEDSEPAFAPDATPTVTLSDETTAVDLTPVEVEPTSSRVSESLEADATSSDSRDEALSPDAYDTPPAEPAPPHRQVEVQRPKRRTSPLQPIVRALTLLNYPLRMLPAGVRPMVDWAALSLLAWVPIVWILAMMINRGSFMGGAEQLAAETPDEAVAIMHNESTHVAGEHAAKQTQGSNDH